MTRVILARHGETDWNVAGRIQGSTDIGLNSRGLRQAQALATRIAEEPITAIYASHLQRALVTAQANARPGRPEVTVSRALRERDHGIFEGLTASEIVGRFPTEHARWMSRDPAYVIPNGESTDMLRTRAIAEILRLAHAHPERTILVVSHGGVLDVVYRYALGIAGSTERTWRLRNAAFNEIDIHGTQITLRTWADELHLDSAGL